MTLYATSVKSHESVVSKSSVAIKAMSGLKIL